LICAFVGLLLKCKMFVTAQTWNTQV